jgi:ATP-dependent helicase/nuclease subunit B
VPSRLIVGPPGAGKTHRLVAVAREAARLGRRVTWVALPHQRHAVYRRLTEDGALLGVEVVSSQQLLYRIVGAARALRPLVTATLRLALMGQALTLSRGVPPTPGEARLFTRAVAEAKAHALSSDDVARAADRLAQGGVADAHEARRLAEIFEHYQASLGERADYDDVRTTALELVRSGRAESGADVIVVDGFRELGPLDLALYRGLGADPDTDVWLALPDAPPSWPPDERLAPRPTRVHAHRFANPVAEMRWVLRALKRDLAEGVRQADLAIITPPGGAHALLALADEFGVPLSNEAPRSLADTREGRVLLDLLELPDAPTASRLLSVPALVPLARAALEGRVAGSAAIAALAGRLEMGALWQEHVRALTPEGDLEAWAARVVEMALACAAADGAAAPDDDAADAPPSAVARDLLLARALEAMRLGSHEGLRAWWAALVQETRLPRRPRAGVALLDATLASGRRFRKVYLLGAVAGAYAAGEREDYFLPEDARAPWSEVQRWAIAGSGAPTAVPAGNGAVAAPARPTGVRGLPRRYRGQDAAIATELLARGDVVVVSAADADRAGPLRADPLLLVDPTPPPPQPAGSTLELAVATPFGPVDGPVLDVSVSAEGLRRSDPCAFRVWAERLVRESDARLPWGVRLRRALTAERRLDGARIEELAAAFPEAAAWLEAHGERLGTLTYGVRLPVSSASPQARIDAAERLGDVVNVVRFVGAGDDPTAVADGRRRWNELYAARSLLRHAGVREVHLVAWPLLGDPVDLTPDGITRDRGAARLDRVARELDASWRRWRAGPAVPTPGHHCSRCRVRDICREAPGR